MKTTLIGHACLLVQSKDTTFLSDPVWFDPHWEEINVMCPSRELDMDKVPRVDILNLSHRHQDHFDVRTLAFLKNHPRILAPDVQVLAPNDPILLDVLRELEYENIRVVTDFESIRIKDLTLTATPSLNKDDFPEHGMLVHDGEVTIWNQVDTIVSPEIIQYMWKHYGQVDFAHLRFVPLLEGSFSFHKALSLPFEEYSSFLKVASALNPKFSVPGSAAFRYTDQFGFLNQYSFPTTQPQFLKDLKDFAPDLKSHTYFPGDVAEITAKGTRIHEQASDFVRVIKDDGLLVEFKPVSEVRGIKTLTADKAGQEKDLEIVSRFIENEFVDRLLKCDVAEAWTHWKIVYQIEVFGEEGSDIWSIDFGAKQIRVVKENLAKINLYEGISCSELRGLIEKTANWDFIGVAAQFRTFNNIYRVLEGRFEFWPPEKKFPQPLVVVFSDDEEMKREKFMKDVRKWKGRI